MEYVLGSDNKPQPGVGLLSSGSEALRLCLGEWNTDGTTKEGPKCRHQTAIGGQRAWIAVMASEGLRLGADEWSSRGHGADRVKKRSLATSHNPAKGFTGSTVGAWKFGSLELLKTGSAALQAESVTLRATPIQSRRHIIGSPGSDHPRD